MRTCVGIKTLKTEAGRYRHLHTGGCRESRAWRSRIRCRFPESDKQQMFVDILPDGPADDGIAYLSFYLEEDADTEAILARVDEELEDIPQLYGSRGECIDRCGQTEDKDWINNWKQYFHQFYVDDI